MSQGLFYYSASKFAWNVSWCGPKSLTDSFLAMHLHAFYAGNPKITEINWRNSGSRMVPLWNFTCNEPKQSNPLFHERPKAFVAIQSPLQPYTEGTAWVRTLWKPNSKKKEIPNFAHSHTTKLSKPKQNTLCPPTVCKLVYFPSNSHSTRHYRGFFWKQSDIR